MQRTVHGHLMNHCFLFSPLYLLIDIILMTKKRKKNKLLLSFVICVICCDVLMSKLSCGINIYMILCCIDMANK